MSEPLCRPPAGHAPQRCPCGGCGSALTGQQRNLCSPGRAVPSVLLLPGVPGLQLHRAGQGRGKFASLADAGCEMDPARFCRFLHALGSAVLFKNACRFSSRRDITSVHKARFTGGWNHAREFKFRSNTQCDCRQQALAHTTFHRYRTLPLCRFLPPGTITIAAKMPFSLLVCFTILLSLQAYLHGSEVMRAAQRALCRCCCCCFHLGRCSGAWQLLLWKQEQDFSSNRRRDIFSRS